MWGSHVIVVMLYASGIRFTTAITSKSKVKLENNRYTGLVIAINPDIPEDYKLIDAIKNAWTEASPILFGATRNRAYFGNITILVPTTWTSNASKLAEASGETYDKADVLVADPNPAYGDAPYTLQYGGCGSQGSYIHLTPNYLTDDSFVRNFGTRGKVIVHEWAHYRWGVFDETSDSDPFYNDPTGNTLYDANTGEKSLSYTQCGKNIEVCCLDQIWQECEPSLWIDNPGQTHCAIDSHGQYSRDCICFTKKSTDIYDASLMSYQYVENIFTFCEDTTNSTSRVKHNKYAPNDQNRLCNMRSTWSVILESADFNNSNLPVSMTSGFSPSFNIKIVPKNQRFVLVLDTSSSMNRPNSNGETRMDQAIKAAGYFITNTVPMGSYVGIVRFSDDASILSYLTKLDGKKARESLAKKLPNLAKGITCIGCGIKSGIEVLEHQTSGAGGGYLIVMTDGRENQSPTVQDVYNTVINKAVTVKTIMVNTDSNDILVRLSIESGGDWFFTGSHDLKALMDAYNKIGTVETGDDKQKKFKVKSETIKMDDTTSVHESEIHIDSTIGNRTVFTYTWSQGSVPPNVAITPPNGSCVISNYQPNTCPSEFEVDNTTKTMTALIPGRAEVGVWKSIVQRSTSASQTVIIAVTSTAADAKIPPIKVESTVKQTNGIPIVYAKVTQGFKPILGAKVIATLAEGGGKKEIPLYDNGAGPDIKRNDGIYSRFLTGIKGGRYTPEISVEPGIGGSLGDVKSNMASAATYNPGYVTSNGTVVANPTGPRFVPKNITSGVASDQLGNFSRQASAGAFEYTPPTPPRRGGDSISLGVATASSGGELDLLAPNKVIDLKVEQNDFANFTNGIVLTFTAPGDDLDSGKATEYEIRLTTGNMETLLNDFTSNDKVNLADVIEGNISNPQEAGSIERIVVSTPNITIGNATSISIGFALRAIDKANNVAQVSNVASLRYYIQPPAFAAPSTTMQPPKTETETVIGETTSLEPTNVLETTTNRTNQPNFSFSETSPATTERNMPAGPTTVSDAETNQELSATTASQKFTTIAETAQTTNPMSTTSILSEELSATTASDKSTGVAETAWTTNPMSTTSTLSEGFFYGRKCQTSLRSQTQASYYGYGYYGYYGYGYYGNYRRCPSAWCQYCIQTVYVYTLGNMQLTRPLCVRGTECRSRYCYGNCQCSTRICSCYRNARYYYRGRSYVTQVRLSYPCGAYSNCYRG